MEKYFYTPKKLTAVAKQIKKEHPKKKHFDLLKIPSDEYRELIEEIASWKEESIPMYAAALSDREVRLLTSYLPLNTFQINKHNHFRAFEYVVNEELAEMFFLQWQDSYEDIECNNFIRKQIEMGEDEYIPELLKNKNYSLDFFSNMLLSETKAFDIGKEIIKHNFFKKMSFVEKLHAFGLQTGRKLTLEIKSLYYTFCKHADYLMVSEQVLLDVLKMYRINEREFLQAFLKNFLTEMSYPELLKFENIAGFFRKKIGEIGSSAFDKCFFALFDDSLVQKYKSWQNAYRLALIFHHDERYMFWRNYQSIKVTPFQKSDSMVIEFEDYYVLEFLEVGRYYIMTREYYEEKASYWIRRNNGTDLKSLLHHRDESEFVAKERHFPPTNNYYDGWCRVARSHMRRNKIAPEIM